MIECLADMRPRGLNSVRGAPDRLCNRPPPGRHRVREAPRRGDCQGRGFVMLTEILRGVIAGAAAAFVSDKLRRERRRNAPGAWAQRRRRSCGRCARSRS